MLVLGSFPPVPLLRRRGGAMFARVLNKKLRFNYIPLQVEPLVPKTDAPGWPTIDDLSPGKVT